MKTDISDVSLLSFWLAFFALSTCLAMPSRFGLEITSSDDVGLISEPDNNIRTPRSKRQAAEKQDPESFLAKYGYLEFASTSEDGSKVDSDEARTIAIIEFQKMSQLPETGILDPFTREKMLAPRCGVADKFPPMDASQPANYEAPGFKWKKNKLTWRLHNGTPDLEYETQRRIFYESFKFWSDVANLTFTEIGQGKADINIKFARPNYDHGDGYGNRFDGPGYVLAHAFFPESGETHFDEAETWTDGEKRGFDLKNVAAHELGHALGLAHSYAPGALMGPYYEYTPTVKLEADDILGIQHLYGARTQPPKTTPAKPTTPKPTPAKPTTPKPTPAKPSTPKPTPKPTPAKPTTPKPTISPDAPDPCNMEFDAVAWGPDTFLYVFKGDWVFALFVNGDILEGFPKHTTEVFPKAPPIVGAAVFNSRSRRFFIFSGTDIWRYTYEHGRYILEWGFPLAREADTVYPRAPEAAFTDSYGRIYIFEGDIFYYFNEYYLSVERYPKQSIQQHFPPIPSQLNAAVNINNQLYFFKKELYYVFERGYGLSDGPAPTSKKWFNCK